MELNILTGLVEQGTSIVPIVEGKRGIYNWAYYRENPAPKYEVENWFRSGKYETFGMFLGSGGINVIDIDVKNVPTDFSGSIFQEIWSNISDEMKKKLVVQRTMSGGEHIGYRCDNIPKHITLSKNPDTKKPIIETIGSQNYIVIYYDVPSGSWGDVGWLTQDEHEQLLQISREVGERFFPEKVVPESKLDRYLEIKNINKKSYSGGIDFVSSSTAQIVKSGVDITEEYEDWIRLGYAFANEASEGGRKYYHEISSLNSSYDPDETDRVYDSMVNGRRKNGKAKAGTIKYLMKKYGIVSATSGKVSNVAEKTVQAITYIRSHGLKFNEFTNKVELKNGDLLTDRDVNNLYLELRKNGISISKNDVASIINSSEIEKINPLNDWLQSTEQYADFTVLEEFLGCLKLKTTNQVYQKFFRDMITKWLMQIPAMVHGGVMPRLVLVIIGDSYIGKSEFFRRLLPPELSKYYSESGLDREKDSEILLSEHLLVNVDELAGIMNSPKSVERFKSMASSHFFTLRTPYGKINERFRRKAVLCGTSNKLDIIMDHDAGNTRIIPVELIDIDKDKLNAIDRDHLFGTLALAYKQADSDIFYLSEDERKLLQSKSDDHTVVNPEQELIIHNLKSCGRGEGVFYSVSEICDYLLSRTNLKIDPRKISRELSKLGFIKARKRVKSSKSALNGFYAIKIGYDEFEEVVDYLRRRQG